MKNLWEKIKSFLVPEEPTCREMQQYLNASTDLADFEQRQRQIEYGKFRQR